MLSKFCSDSNFMLSPFSLDHRPLYLLYSRTDHDDIVSVSLNYQCFWKFQIHSSAFNTLGIFRLDRLFDYGNFLEDTNAVNLINRYYSKLMQVVQPKLQSLNRKRKDRGDLTYPYFIPKWLPNGIQT